MKRWKLFTGIFLVFMLGVLSGTLGTSIYVRHEMKSVHQDPKARRAFVIERLTRRLDLKENQISKIEKILEELDQRRQEYRQEIRKMRTESISRMEKELTPEQQRKFEQLQEEWEGRKNKRRSTK